MVLGFRFVSWNPFGILRSPLNSGSSSGFPFGSREPLWVARFPMRSGFPSGFCLLLSVPAWVLGSPLGLGFLWGRKLCIGTTIVFSNGSWFVEHELLGG